MARRIVMLGPVRCSRVLAAEVSPLQAAAYVGGGNWRVAFTCYEGTLADATVIVRTSPWDAHGTDASDVGWEFALTLGGVPHESVFGIDVPIPVGLAAP